MASIIPEPYLTERAQLVIVLAGLRADRVTLVNAVNAQHFYERRSP